MIVRDNVIFGFVEKNKRSAMVTIEKKIGGDHQWMTYAAVKSLSLEEQEFLEPEKELLITTYCEFPDLNWLLYGEWGGWSGFPNEPRTPDYRREWNVSYYYGWDPGTDKGIKIMLHAPPDAYKACRIYTNKAWESFDNGNLADGIRFLGVLSHYIEDCATFAHMQALHRGAEFDFKSIIIDSYKPNLLGRTKKEAVEGIVKRLRILVRYIEEMSIPLRKAIKDNNQKEYNSIHLEGAQEGARVLADTLHTIISLAGRKPKIKRSPCAINLINNPSFEFDDGSGYPDNWVIVYKDLYDKVGRAEYEGLFTRRPRLTHGGKHSAKLMWTSKEGMEWIQRWPSALSVKKREVYKCSGWIRTQDAKGETYIGACLYRRNNEEIATFKSKSLCGTCDWQKVSFIFRIPEGAEKIRVACLSKGNNGAAWFDDIELIKIKKRENIKKTLTKDISLLKLDFNEEKLREFYRTSTAVMGANILDSSHYYELNAPIISCSGNKISDLHLNDIDGFDYVLRFDGKDDFVEVPYYIGQDILNPEKDVTIALWVFIEEYKDAYIICKETKGKSNYSGYRIDTTKEGYIRFIVSNNEADTHFCRAKFKKNRWMHVAAILGKDGLQRIYLDGKLMDGKKNEVEIAGCHKKSFNLYIGSNYGVNDFLKGMIAKVRIYGTVLGLKEIINVMKGKEIEERTKHSIETGKKIGYTLMQRK